MDEDQASGYRWEDLWRLESAPWEFAVVLLVVAIVLTHAFFVDDSTTQRAEAMHIAFVTGADCQVSLDKKGFTVQWKGKQATSDSLRVFQLEEQKGEQEHYELILAPEGAVDNYLSWPGVEEVWEYICDKEAIKIIAAYKVGAPSDKRTMDLRLELMQKGV